VTRAPRGIGAHVGWETRIDLILAPATGLVVPQEAVLIPDPGVDLAVTSVVAILGAGLKSRASGGKTEVNIPG
jgi:hypothetical protein